MEIAYSAKALLDIEFWRKSGSKAIQKKISQLIVAIQDNPYKGIGKPEALKHELSGKWSRRIDSEHRVIYELNESDLSIKIHSLRGHY